MLENLQCVHINPAPLRSQPIGRGMDERTIRFELERQACQSLRKVLQLKLQQRRTREELASQAMMPPLKSSAAFHEQRRSLEHARSEEDLKRKMKSKPEQSGLIRMHILEGSSLESSYQAKQLQLKKARLVEGLNSKVSHHPGSIELIHRNSLPVHSSIKPAIMEFTKTSGENSSCDEHSNDSLSPERLVSQDCPLGSGLVHSPSENLSQSGIPSPTQIPPPPLSLPMCGSSRSLTLTNESLTGGTNSLMKPKLNSDRFCQKNKKLKDIKPKIKKLKYHQYIPPDRKGDKEPPPHLDSSYAKILQQQQLFLQLQILSQQQNHNYHTILPAPPKDQTQSPSSCPTSTSSPPRPAAVPAADASCQQSTCMTPAAPFAEIKAAAFNPNLDGMKVTELRSELKLRSLPISGTKNDLIERLKCYQDVSQAEDAVLSPTAEGTTELELDGDLTSCDIAPAATASSSSSSSSSSPPEQRHQQHETSLNAGAGSGFSPASTPEQPLTYGGNISPLTPQSSSPAFMSPRGVGLKNDPLGELSSSLTEFTLQPSLVARRPGSSKKDPPCRTATPCQFSLQSAALQKHCVTTSSAAAAGAAPLAAADKDRMLQEKDRQIAELTRMLKQKQKLVEALKMQLEYENRGASEPLILLRVKEEPADNNKPPRMMSPDEADVSIKQEAAEVEIGETRDRPGECNVSLQASTQEMKDWVQMQLQPGQKSFQKKQEHGCVQGSAVRLAQQPVMQRGQTHQQQHQHQALQSQMHVTQLKVCQYKPNNSQKLQLRAGETHQQQQQPCCNHLQQQNVVKQHKPVLFQKELKQKQTKPQWQQQVQPRVKQQQKFPSTYSHQLSSTSSVQMGHVPNASTPVVLGDRHGNYFPTSRSDGKMCDRVPLQRLQSTSGKLPSHLSVPSGRIERGPKQQHLGHLKHLKTKIQKGVPQVSVPVPEQKTPECLSAPPNLQPFFLDQGFPLTGVDPSSPTDHNDLCHDLDVLLSPLSPASVRTGSLLPDISEKENQDDIIDIILQGGEMSFKPSLDLSFDSPNPSSFSSPSPPLLPHLLLSSPVPCPCDPSAPAAAPQLDPSTDKHLTLSTSGRLEDFLESTTGKPLLGVEPGGVITLIDDLHSQLLCTPSILDHPPSPMDTLDTAGGWEHEFDNWLDDSPDGERGGDTPTLAPLGPQTPVSVFSADFPDTSELHLHWDSCF